MQVVEQGNLLGILSSCDEEVKQSWWRDAEVYEADGSPAMSQNWLRSEYPGKCPMAASMSHWIWASSEEWTPGLDSYVQRSKLEGAES